MWPTFESDCVVDDELALELDSASVGGTWDISNSDRLGKSEVQLCNVMIEGCAKLIQWEQKLEQGGSIR